MLGVATLDVNGEGVVVCGHIPYHCKTPVNSAMFAMVQTCMT